MTAPQVLAAKFRYSGMLRRHATHAAPWLAVWLPAEVDAEVDRAMRDRPSLGLALDKAAQEVLKAEIRRYAPQVADMKCAPLPARHAGAEAELAAAGLRRLPSGTLAVRYGVLTWQGRVDARGRAIGCVQCMLAKDCPRRQGG